MSRHDDIYKDRIKTLEREDLYANAIHRLTSRIVALEAANTELVAACREALARLQLDLYRSDMVLIDQLRAAIANSKGE